MSATATRKRRPRRRAASPTVTKAIAAIDLALMLFAEVVREAEYADADRMALGCADACDTARPDLLFARRELLLTVTRDHGGESKIEAEAACMAAAMLAVK